ncbi:MAG: hypothetical protein AAGA20_05995 [Planctomycetota bacterium]
MTLLVAIGGLVYLVARFDLVSLPAEGCSPVAAYAPGDRVVVDRRTSGLAAGDAVFVRDQAGTMHLTTVLERRASDGALWCAPDVSDCPGFSSEESGWVSTDAVVGRVLLAWNF